ncbi:4c072830-efe2-43c2-90a3-f102ef34105f [Thermothielavioides terrestris]|uniref:4c072830-efe2-43c2-90a3-f102ef34105f n=1 Tax=Thermothielavioides terrestris TaxID=2587410 RepID=A0A446BLT6_9PEZI|nr:4c072830-efe2-43c2-90a3-f102ef34105f [Thermothielavioides terrestris]
MPDKIFYSLSTPRGTDRELVLRLERRSHLNTPLVLDWQAHTITYAEDGSSATLAWETPGIVDHYMGPIPARRESVDVQMPADSVVVADFDLLPRAFEGIALPVYALSRRDVAVFFVQPSARGAAACDRPVVVGFGNGIFEYGDGELVEVVAGAGSEVMQADGRTGAQVLWEAVVELFPNLRVRFASEMMMSSVKAER